MDRKLLMQKTFPLVSLLKPTYRSHINSLTTATDHMHSIFYRRGWKFRENFKMLYEPFVNEWRRGPMGLASAQQAYIRARGEDDPAIPPLPDGWKSELDDQQKRTTLQLLGEAYQLKGEHHTAALCFAGMLPDKF